MPSSILNSDDGVISGTSGLKSSGGDDGSLKIQTNGTDAASVTSGQVVSFVNNFGTVANLPAYQCRAWVNFDGTGTPAIRESGNVSSITDSGAGTYKVNFTTALSDINYSVVGTSGGTGDETGDTGRTLMTCNNSSVNFTAVFTKNSSTGALDDYNTNSVAVFR
jgi:hypothetical protein